MYANGSRHFRCQKRDLLTTSGIYACRSEGVIVFLRLTAACNLFDDRYKCGHPLECAGYHSAYAGLDFINMLLEVPSGLMHFTEIQISCMRDRLLLAVRLLETSCRTLTNLCHTVPVDKSRPSYAWSVDADVISRCRWSRNF